jgi:C4-dicarboxylate transporter DctQ subunit
MKRTLATLDSMVSWLESVLISVCMVSALALGSLQVVMRYGFGSGITWAGTVFVMLAAAGMMFAGSRAVRNDDHVRVEIIYDLFPSAARRGLDIASSLISLILCVYYAICGWLYVAFLQIINSISPATGLPDWIFFLLVPLVFFLFSVRYVIRLILTLSGTPLPPRRHQSPEAELPL